MTLVPRLMECFASAHGGCFGGGWRFIPMSENYKALGVAAVLGPGADDAEIVGTIGRLVDRRVASQRVEGAA